MIKSELKGEYNSDFYIKLCKYVNQALQRDPKSL